MNACSLKAPERLYGHDGFFLPHLMVSRFSLPCASTLQPPQVCECWGCRPGGGSKKETLRMRQEVKLKGIFKVLVLVFATLFGSTLLLAQQNVGKILGSVHDPSGATIPGARITVQHLASGQKWETVATGAGEYVFSALQIGEYSLRAGAAGFKTVERPSVRVVSGVTLSVDFNLEVGATTQ